MSKFVSEIVYDIRKNPKTWIKTGNGLKKDGVLLTKFGNGSKYFLFWGTSIVSVQPNTKEEWIRTSFVDKYRLEEAFVWWMKNASVEMLKCATGNV